MIVSEILRRGPNTSNGQPATWPASEDFVGAGSDDAGGDETGRTDHVATPTATLIRGDAGECEHVSLKQNLLVRLFKDCFVSIEASACKDLSQASSKDLELAGTDAAATSRVERQSKLCLVDDWRGARIFEANGSQLWPTSSPENYTNSQYDDQSQQHQGQHTNQSSVTNSRQAAASSFVLQSDTARLAFASATSVISLLGILANLLILVIIVINTKQKLPNFSLSRGSQTSNTNNHFVLLFQLTLTGLLIGSCALLNTASQLSHNHHDGKLDAAIDSNSDHTPHNYYDPVTWSQSSFSVHMESHAGNTAGDPLERMQFLQDPPRDHLRSRQMALLISLEQAESDDGRRVDVMTAGEMIDLVQRQAFEIVQAERLNLSSDPPARPASPINLSRVLFDLIAAIYIWTVAGLAFDRYCAIAYPLEYLRAVSSARVRNFLLASWLFAVLLLVLMPAAVNLLGDDAPDKGPSRSINEITAADDAAASMQDQSSVQFLLKCSQLSAQQGEDRISQTNNDDDDEQTDKLVETLSAIWRVGGAQTGPQLASKQLLQVSLSLVIFLLVVVAPLAIATICNLSIYGIVKGHERRMSASLSSQQAAGGGGDSIAGAASFASSLRQNWSLFKRDGSFCSSTNQPAGDHLQHHKRHCDTCSSTSSIFGKLVRASQQVGASMACRQASALARRSSSTWSSGSSKSSSSELAGSSGKSDLEARQRLLEHRPICEASVCRCDFSAPNSQRSSFHSTQGSAAAMYSLVKRRKRNVPIGDHYQHGHHHHQQQQQQPSPRLVVAAAKRKLKRKLSDTDQLEERAFAAAATCYGAHRSRLLLNKRQTSFDSHGRECRICCCPASRPTSCGLPHHLNNQNLISSCAKQNLGSHLDSDGLMRQLKLAGLSFAGIPINELIRNGCDARRPLNRSSSCSLGYLNTLQQVGHALDYPAPSGGRFSTLYDARTSNKLQTLRQCHASDKKSSLVSLVDESSGRRCQTQLLSDQEVGLDSFESLATGAGNDMKQQRALFGYANLCGPPSGADSQMSAANQNRVQFNIVFNVVVWLILLLLACSIPHYCLMMMLQLGPPARQPPNFNGSAEEILDDFLQDYSLDKIASRRQMHPRQMSTFIRVALPFLTCLCDLLFLLTLPLNAWLYGIRSRSLKATLKMMLRKYISKRQASIEIDQRRKSVIMQRSRDSSTVGLIGPAQGDAGRRPVCACHHQLRGFTQPNQQQRVVRRCASFNLPVDCLPSRLHHFDEKPPPPPPRQLPLPLDLERTTPRGKLERTLSASSATETAATSLTSPTQKAQANSIRFVLGDEHHQSEAATKRFQSEPEVTSLRQGLLDCLASSFLGQPAGSRLLTSTSLNSTPAISNRSLLSASIKSSQSAALLLLTGAALGDEMGNSGGTLQIPKASQVNLDAQPLSGVLKNSPRRAIIRQRQESCESAVASSGPRGGHTILARVQSSPGELVASGAVQLRAQLKPEQARHHFGLNDPTEFGAPNHKTDVSANNIKLLLTSADGEDPQEPLVGGGGEHPSETKPTDEFCVAQTTTTADPARGGKSDMQQAHIEAGSHHSADYCRQIKEAIGRYFASSQRRRRLGASNKRRRRLGQAARCSCEFESRSKRLRKNPVEFSRMGSMFSPERAEIEAERRWQETSPIGGGGDQRLKPSQSSDSFLQTDSMVSRAEMKRPPPVHLKPPGSLRLVNLEHLLTGGPTPAVYSSLLALSPIKECSSNHSCASSLSSLNNALGQQPQQPG